MSRNTMIRPRPSEGKGLDGEDLNRRCTLAKSTGQLSIGVGIYALFEGQASLMKPTQCVFCGVALTLPGAGQRDSRTKEHVYARWFRDNVVNNKIKMFTSDGTSATMHR